MSDLNWNRLFNSRMERLNPSVIQEMMSLISRPGCISFTAGEPSMDLHPMEKLRQAINETLFSNPEVLAYSDPSGDPELRAWISAWLKKKGYASFEPGMERILLTNGSQAGLNFLSLMFLTEGDKILVEDPSYTEAILSFGKEGVAFLPVPLEEEGPDLDVMEDFLKKNRVSFFYTVPTFQNPSGRSISKEKKMKILELAEKYDFLIVEDDPYRELWYDSSPPATFLSLSSDNERVIYLGSFSKIVAPGVRCGYMVLPLSVMAKASDLRVAIEINLPSLIHKALLKVVDDPIFPLHLDNLRSTYRARRDCMVRDVSEFLAPLGFRFSIPQGGFFLWGSMNELDGLEFSRYAAIHEKIGVIPGEGFFVGGGGKDYLRFSFAQVLPEQSREGMLRLERAFRGFREKQ